MTPEQHLRTLMKIDVAHMTKARRRTKKSVMLDAGGWTYLAVKSSTTWERAIRVEPPVEKIDALRLSHGDDAAEERWPGAARMIEMRETYRRRHPQQVAA